MEEYLKMIADNNFKTEQIQIKIINFSPIFKYCNTFKNWIKSFFSIRPARHVNIFMYKNQKTMLNLKRVDE